MTDYDNTDRGSFFKPRADMSLLVQGPLNSQGSDYRVVIIKNALPDGGATRDVYIKAGTLYENDKSLNKDLPDFSGPVTMPDGEKRRIACWKTISKDGNTKFLSARIGDSTPRKQDNNNNEEPARDQTIVEHESVLGDINDPDEIPF